MYIKRKLEQKIPELSKSFPVVMVTGARQVGKTTMLKTISEPGRAFVSLDIPANRLLAAEEPEAFLSMYKPPVIIDEFQYAPGLLPYIKAYADTHQSPGGFWLTGSQNFSAMKNVSESLAGRAGIINLFSLSRSEISGDLYGEYTTDINKLTRRQNTAARMDKKQIFENIARGGMPHLYKNLPLTARDYFDAYCQTYLSRDIRDLAQVADELAFYKFMRICAVLASQQADYTEISKRAGITLNKAKQWISVLVSSGIIILLPPYYNNALKRIVKTPKIYFMDTGLLCYLRGIEDGAALMASADSGAFFENYVVSEIYKSFANEGMRPPLYYYRDANNRREIDLIIERGGTIYPIEIKESSNPDKKSAKHFGALLPVETENIKIGTGSVICTCSELYPINGVWAVPCFLV